MRYPKTKKKLFEFLRKKWYEPTEINEAIDKLVEQNIVDDRQFAESYLFAHWVRKWKPAFEVKGKLLQQWVDAETIDELLQEFSHELDQWALDWATKYAKTYANRGDDYYTIKQKLWRRGYSKDIVDQAVECINDDDKR